MPNYVPGGSQPLVKAILAATDGKAMESIEVYFNPKEITVDKPVPWQKHKHAEGDDPTLEFTAAEPKTFACELMFDMFEARGDVYKEYVSRLETLTLIDKDLARPPMCTFTWGNAMPVFQGVVEDLNVKYTLFLPDGTPCRATVNLKMKQAHSLYNKKEAEEANKKAKGRKRRTPPRTPAPVARPAARRLVPRWTAPRRRVLLPTAPANPPRRAKRGPRTWRTKA
jgi:hypothetical protein